MQALPEFAAAGVVLRVTVTVPMLAEEASANATNMILSSSLPAQNNV